MVRVSRGLAVAGLLIGVAAATAATPTAKSSDTFASKSPKQPPVIIAPPPAEVVAEAIRAEMDAFARRFEVCTRLRQIAAETGDDRLQQQVEDLERQATVLYQARVARMGVKTSEPPRVDAAGERKLGTTVDPLKVGPPTPGTGGKR